MLQTKQSYFLYSLVCIFIYYIQNGYMSQLIKQISQFQGYCHHFCRNSGSTRYSVFIHFSLIASISFIPAFTSSMDHQPLFILEDAASVLMSQSLKVFSKILRAVDENDQAGFQKGRTCVD